MCNFQCSSLFLGPDLRAYVFLFMGKIYTTLKMIKFMIALKNRRSFFYQLVLFAQENLANAFTVEVNL